MYSPLKKNKLELHFLEFLGIQFYKNKQAHSLLCLRANLSAWIDIIGI